MITPNTFEEFRKEFIDFYNTVKLAHLNSTSINRGGHGFDHDITVAMIAVKIAPSIRLGQKAWCAGMLHSIDRIVESKDVNNVTVEYSCLLGHFFDVDEIDEIVEAALRHSELNNDDHNETQVVLMDADRLANMQLAVVIRGGQFKSQLPVFDFKYLNGSKNPESSYEDPKSVLDGLRLIISQYIPQLRLPKAKELGLVYSQDLNAYIKSIEQDYEDLGLKNIDI